MIFYFFCYIPVQFRQNKTNTSFISLASVFGVRGRRERRVFLHHNFQIATSSETLQPAIHSALLCAPGPSNCTLPPVLPPKIWLQIRTHFSLLVCSKNKNSLFPVPAAFWTNVWREKHVRSEPQGTLKARSRPRQSRGSLLKKRMRLQSWREVSRNRSCCCKNSKAARRYDPPAV